MRMRSSVAGVSDAWSAFLDAEEAAADRGHASVGRGEVEGGPERAGPRAPASDSYQAPTF
jgi:hypothetical protein